jgi:hypothetical protein
MQPVQTNNLDKFAGQIPWTIYLDINGVAQSYFSSRKITLRYTMRD